ncbi:MAG: CBS domain-containing protein [Candidatus Omnitrophica bacterium]|nr:CBS domain-containing protein [Candidatus Omnitrophota bacterium]
MLVGEIMTKEVITVTPETSLRTAGEIMKEKRISGMPVVDAQGNIMGIITLTDMMKILDNIYKWKEIEKRAPELHLSQMYEIQKANSKVKDFMTLDVFTLSESDPIEDAAKKMFYNGVHSLPVVRDGKLIGIFGKRDLVYACF